MRPCGVCGTALWFDQWNCSRTHICAESGIARNLWCSWPPSAVEESESGEQRQQSGGDEARVTRASVSVSSLFHPHILPRPHSLCGSSMRRPKTADLVGLHLLLSAVHSACGEKEDPRGRREASSACLLSGTSL